VHRLDAGADEMRVALEEWLGKFLDLALTPGAVVKWSAGTVRGPRQLPITLDLGENDHSDWKPRAAADSLSRRHVLAGAGALAATGLLPCYEAPAQGGRANVIDTHHHFYPPDYHKAWSQ
jgi:hypothetical protein